MLAAPWVALCWLRHQHQQFVFSFPEPHRHRRMEFSRSSDTRSLLNLAARHIAMPHWKGNAATSRRTPNDCRSFQDPRAIGWCRPGTRLWVYSGWRCCCRCLPFVPATARRSSGGRTTRWRTSRIIWNLNSIVISTTPRCQTKDQKSNDRKRSHFIHRTLPLILLRL
jgi:hypothetical protein